MNETINYYIIIDEMYVVFVLEAMKIFDRVKYCKLFNYIIVIYVHK